MAKKTDEPITLEDISSAIKKLDQRETLVIKIDWWLGRVIAMAWPISELAKTRKVKVITSRPLVFWWNPYIESVHWLDDRDLFRQVIKGNDYLELEPYTDHRFFNDWVNRLEIARDKLGLKEVVPPALFLAEHEKLSNFLQGRPVLFQPFWSTMDINGADKSYRSFRIWDAQYVADCLTQAWYTLYEVIKPNAQPKLRGCQILDTPNLRRVVTLCDRYPVIWCDSCLHHASKAFGKKAVVMRAWTDAGRFGYDTSINLWEQWMKEYTPMRLWINDFNFDVINQYSNVFTKQFLDKFVAESLNLLQSRYK